MTTRCQEGTCHATCLAQPCPVLGPFPATAVTVLADLGLSDREIAAYFRVDPHRISRLRLSGVPELRHVCEGSASLTCGLAQE
jgi:hypothetical protein